MSLDQNAYENWQQQQQERWEALCVRCGACCGAFDGDPCEHLRTDVSQKYYCVVYENRFVVQKKTLTGKNINCVPIRGILNSSWLGDSICGYKKKI
ncbi:MAG: hypothetical protein WCH62_03815 [Candidatus Omnitrophota bacterium]